MGLSKLLLSVAVGSGLGLAASAASGAIINVDYNGAGTDYTGPGLLGTPGKTMTWNYMSSGNATAESLLDSTGATTSVTMTRTNMSSNTDLGGNAPVGFGALYTGYLYFTSGSIVLSGLDPSRKYDVVFFSGFSNDNNGTLNRHYGAEITHNTTTLRSYGNLGTGGSTTLTEGQNYVHFKNLSPTGGGTLTFAAATNTAVDPNVPGFKLGGVGVINGIQIAIPEPATMGLLGLGALILTARGRRSA